MKVTMQSTDKTVILGGMNFRVWEGVSDTGLRFVSLVNRSQAVNPADQVKLISELAVKHKSPDATTDPALVAMGVIPPPPSGQV